MTDSQQPPRFTLRLLRVICPEHLHEAIEGDILEWFDDDYQRHGHRRATFNMFWNVLRFARPAILSRRVSKYSHRPPNMLLPFIRTSFRNLKAHRLTATINGLGLAVGMCAAMIIFSILQFEQSFDAFHTDADRIYRIVRISQVEGETEYRTGSVYPLAPAIEESVSAVEITTSMLYWDWEDLKVSIAASDGGRPKMFSETTGIGFVQSSFFDMFDFQGTDFHWIAGDPKTALKEPFTVVLSASLAKKYFGESDPLDQIISVNNDSEYKVTGVISDLPANTDFPFTMMLSYASLMEYVGDRVNNWWPVGDNQVYLRAQPSVTIAELNASLHEVHAANTPEKLHSFRTYQVQPLSAVHTDARFGNFNHRVVSVQRFWTLAAVGLFLLIAACINYVNLATARASLRSREIGVRKVMGSNRRQLIGQFMTESFLLTGMAAITALLLAELFSNYFRGLMSSATHQLLITDPAFWGGFGTIVIIVTLLAGLYPAIVISGFGPLTALKGAVNSQGLMPLRRLLVVFQFMLTIAFLIGTFTVIRQVSYFESVDLGFDRDAIVNLNLPDNGGALDVFANELRTSPLIEDVSFSSTLPSGMQRPSSFWDIRRGESGGESLVTEVIHVDTSYFSLYGIDMIAGRNFRSSEVNNGIIVNETLARKLGFIDPSEALGQSCKVGRGDHKILGVIKDFHSKSLRDEIDKLTFFLDPEVANVVSISLSQPTSGVSAIEAREALQHIEASWERVFPDDAMNFRFFDENINGFYAEELRFASLLQVFTTVLLFIGGLGLYGLIAFVVNRRMKEMAIRKTFGASGSSVLQLLSSDFLRLLIVAFLFAAPTAYWLMQRWLADFQYHVELNWWTIVAPFMIVLAMALLIVLGQGRRAARVNPATILRDE